MNILFLTLLDFDTIEERNIYTDLLREFSENSHSVYIVSPFEKRSHKCERIIDENNSKILKVEIGNTQKTNLIEKGISTLTLEGLILKAIKKNFSSVKFDLVIYSTPPITFAKVIEYVKKRDNAKSYLLLKDIFPQNAVDLRMFSKSSPIYKFFRAKEKKLYKVSDFIGCMSEANVKYLLSHNKNIDKEIVEICPNSFKVQNIEISDEEKRRIREKYGIPVDKRVLVYGGNIGKPQGIDYLIECLSAQKDDSDNFYLVVGSGTEYQKLEKYYKEAGQDNFKLITMLPRQDYEKLVNCCDIGLIFLDKRFTIPNFPSRMLSYMQASMPIIAATDKNTDIKDVISDGDFGWWCESENATDFSNIISKITDESVADKGKNARKYLIDNYSVERCFEIIMERMK